MILSNIANSLFIDYENNFIKTDTILDALPVSLSLCFKASSQG